MEEDSGHITEKILNLTLEFIYLLTGERCAVVKMAAMETLFQEMFPRMSSNQKASPLPSELSPTPEKTNQQKILEVTNKIIELLTGKVPVMCQDVAIHLSLEEQEYLEGHKERYDDTMMEVHRLLPSPIIKLLPPSEDNAETCIQAEYVSPADGCSTRNTPEGSPRPLYSQDSTQEVLPHHYQENKPARYEDEVAPETHARDAELCIKQEEMSSEVGTDEHPTSWNMSEHCVSSVTYKSEDDLSTCPQGGILELPYADQLSHPSRPYVCSLPASHPVPQRPSRPFLCPTCGKCFSSTERLTSHQKSHTAKKLHAEACRKCFSYRSKLLTHKILPVRPMPFSCSECGKSFSQKSYHRPHGRIHAAGENRPSCSHCGKTFPSRSQLIRHERVHTAEKPYSCSHCGKCFSQNSNLMRHKKIHSEEKVVK